MNDLTQGFDSIYKFLEGYFGVFLNQLSFGLFLIGILVTIFLLKNRPKYKSVVELLPSAWTAFGILGTFVSLIVGFSGLDLSGNSSDINQLPYVLSNAFLTSIAGIIVSQYLSFYLSKFEDEELTKEYFREPPEKILFDLKNNTWKQNYEIIELLKNTNSILMTLDKKIGSTMPELIDEFGKTMQSISLMIKSNISDLNKDMFTQIQGVLDGFKQVTADAGEHTKQMNKYNVSAIVIEMKKLMEGFASEVTGLQSNLTAGNQNHLIRHEELMSKQEKSINDFEIKANKSREEILNQSQGFQTDLVEAQRAGISDYLSEMGRIREESSDSAKKAQVAYESMVNSIEVQTKIILEELKAQTSDVSIQIGNWVDVSDNTLHATSERLKESVTAFDNQKNNQKMVLENMNKQLEGLKALYETEKFTQQRFEAYDNRTNDIEAIMSQLVELAKTLKNHLEKQEADV